MRVVLVALGSRGDIYPFLGLGRAIMARGHAVALITSSNYEAEVKDAGIEYIELCSGETYEAITTMLERWGTFIHRHPLDWVSMSSWRKHASQRDADALDLLRTLTPAGLYRKIEETCTSPDDVLATTDLFAFGAGGIAHEKLGLPHASISLMPAVFQFVQPALPLIPRGVQDKLKNSMLSSIWLVRWVKRNYDALRRDLGLEPRSGFLRNLCGSEQLDIALFPDWFMRPPKGLANNALATDFPMYEVGADDDLPADLEAFLQAGPPPVVFATASWQSNLYDYFMTAIATCQSLGVRGVLMTGNSNLFPDLNTPSMIAVNYASFHKLLPRAAALVSHGGMGTCSRAMAEGTPQIIIPNSPGDAYNRALVKRLGTGTGFDGKDFKKKIEPSLKRILGSDEMRANCRKIAQRFPVTPNLEGAIDRLERLAEAAPRRRTARPVV